MRQFHLLVFLLLFPVVGFAQAEQAHLPGQLIARLQPNVMATAEREAIRHPEVAAILAELGVSRVMQRYPASKPPNPEGDARQADIRPLYTLFFDADRPVIPLANTLSKYTQFFAYVEPLYIQTPLAPYSPNPFDSATSWHHVMVKAQEAWGIQQGDSTITIGIIDTGTQWEHPDMEDNIAYNWADPVDGIDNDGNGFTDDFLGWDFAGAEVAVYDPDNNPTMDCDDAASGFSGHGTAVAGFAGATFDNGTQANGTGAFCRIIPVKTTSENDPNSGIQNGYDGIVYCADRGATAINCSWGGTGFSNYALDIIRYATFTQNSLVVAAAGNTPGSAVFYPAGYEPVLAVSAVGPDTNLFLSSGCNCDITAPGNGRSITWCDGNSTGTIPYTSFSSPIVAAAAGLVKAQFPSYTAEQIGHQLRVTASPAMYGLPQNAGQQFQFGIGLLQMDAALTSSIPALRYTNLQLTDNENDIIESGDTLEFLFTYRNYLAATSGALAVQLEAYEGTAYIQQVLMGTVTLGSINTLASKTQSIPFRVVLSPNTPDNATIRFRLRYSDNGYADYECLTIFANPTYVDVSTQLLLTSENSIGRFGYNNPPNNTQGQGFRVNETNHLYEGGFVVGRSVSQVSDNMRNSFGGLSEDFIAQQNVQLLEPGEIAVQEALARFSDNGAANPLKLNFDVETFSFFDAPNEKFFLKRLIVRNPEPFVKSNLYAGFYADWDLGLTSSNDSGSFDPSRNLLYTWGDETEPGRHVGIGLLAGDLAGAFSANNAETFYNDSTRFAMLTAGTDSATKYNKDVLQLLSAGPFELLPLGVDTFMFVLLTGNSLNDLRDQYDRALSTYNCFFKAQPLSVNLGPNRAACAATILDATTPGATGYLWNTNDVSPTLTVTASGSYSVQVFNAQGCSYPAAVNITIQQPLNPVVTIQDTLLNLSENERLVFSDATPTATSWVWEFGDGFGFMGKSGSYTYTAPGDYVVRTILSNGACIDTVETPVRVSSTTARGNALAGQFRVYPNPSTGWVNLDFTALVGEVQVQLTNGLGQVVWAGTVPGGRESRLEMASFPAGVYQLRLVTASGVANVSIAKN